MISHENRHANDSPYQPTAQAVLQGLESSRDRTRKLK
jgi:hypothetical protein